MEETRLFSLEEHRCALLLVQVDPELMWMFGIPDPFLPTYLILLRKSVASEVFCILWH